VRWKTFIWFWSRFIQETSSYHAEPQRAMCYSVVYSHKCCLWTTSKTSFKVESLFAKWYDFNIKRNIVYTLHRNKMSVSRQNQHVLWLLLRCTTTKLNRRERRRTLQDALSTTPMIHFLIHSFFCAPVFSLPQLRR